MRSCLSHIDGGLAVHNSWLSSSQRQHLADVDVAMELIQQHTRLIV